MKIRLTRPAAEPGGFASGRQETKVLVWPDDQPLPAGAETVGDGSQEHDWALPEDETAARAAAKDAAQSSSPGTANGADAAKEAK